MGTSIHGVNTVSKAKGGLGKTIIILKCCLNYGAVCRFRGIKGLVMAHRPVPVKVANEASNPAIKVEGLGPFVAFLFLPKRYFQTLIQVGHLSHPFTQEVEIIADSIEYLLIGKEGDGGAGISGFTNLGYLSLGYALLVFLLV